MTLSSTARVGDRSLIACVSAEHRGTGPWAAATAGRAALDLRAAKKVVSTDVGRVG
jgi:hypothetical protein